MNDIPGIQKQGIGIESDGVIRLSLILRIPPESLRGGDGPGRILLIQDRLQIRSETKLHYRLHAILKSVVLGVNTMLTRMSSRKIRNSCEILAR
jgi:hypothetical protein